MYDAALPKPQVHRGIRISYPLFLLNKAINHTACELGRLGPAERWSKVQAYISVRLLVTTPSLLLLGGPTHTLRARGKKKNSDQIKYLTEPEEHDLLRAVARSGNLRNIALFELTLGRGLRRGEVGLVKMEHLNLDTRVLKVTRIKNGINRECLLTDVEWDALKSWLRKRGKESGPLFPSQRRTGISGAARGPSLARH